MCQDSVHRKTGGRGEKWSRVVTQITEGLVHLSRVLGSILTNTGSKKGF